MKTKKFAPKDAKLTREHEGATPEYLLDLGLSKKAYLRLTEVMTQTEIVQPVRVEQLQATKTPQPDVVQLHNRKSGRVVRMGYKSASMLSRKYPEEFNIIS